MITSCNTFPDQKELKLAHSLPVDHPAQLAMEFMAKQVEKLSEEKLLIKIYPSGQLGSEQQCLELLQIGSLFITKVSAGTMESFIDAYKVFGLPYVFRSKEHTFQILEGEKEPFGDWWSPY
jgi:TRAP-type C4-dicarboxylate transport system substrate-binding protein